MTEEYSGQYSRKFGLNAASCGFGSSISETLDIVEAGLRRLGITSDRAPCRISGAIRITQDMPPVQDVTPAMVERMVALTQEGLTQKQIAEQLGCSQSAVCKNLRKIGIGLRLQRQRQVAA